jgi:hypothetical protein
VFNGPPPTVHALKSESEETTLIGKWIAERTESGVLPHEFGVFVRSAFGHDRTKKAVCLSSTVAFDLSSAKEIFIVCSP